MRTSRRLRVGKSQRQRGTLLLGLVLLFPIACAEGVQDTPEGDNGGLGAAGNGSSGNHSGAGAGGAMSGAGRGGSGASGGSLGGASNAGAGGKLGGAGAGGKANGGSGGDSGGTTAGAGAGGKANGGAPGGGAGGSMAGAPGAGGAPTVAGFSVQYKNEHTEATGSYIGGEVMVKNAGPNSLGVSDLKVRYYFTDEPKKAPKITNNYANIMTSGANADLTVSEQVVGMAPTAPTADTYIEFSFSSGNHGALGPGEALHFAWQFEGPNPATDKFTQSNDYSFDATKTSLSNWEHIVLLQGTNRLWGTTP